MCGRYSVGDEIGSEIERFLLRIDQTLRTYPENPFPSVRIKGDIHPTDIAPVLVSERGGIACRLLRWGMPGYDTKDGGRVQVIFNARSESAMRRPMFREGIGRRRIIIPAAWFYEWNGKKEKNLFRKQEEGLLLMAGCYNRYEDGDRFVILTTEANASMKTIHDRMPLILEPGEAVEWLLQDESTERLLQRKPSLLKVQTDYEQLSLF